MGCHGSKPSVAAAAAQPAAKDTALEQPLTEQKPETKPEEKAREVPPLKFKINSAHGLRPADIAQNKSDVVVEVHIEGKPESRIKTSVVTGHSQLRADAEQGAKPSVEVEFKFHGELKGYNPGDKIIFEVKDKDILTADVLGRAVVTDPNFGGRLDLEHAGDGYKAFLLVQLGEGTAITNVLQSMEDSLMSAKKKLEEAWHKTQEQFDNHKAANHAAQDQVVTVQDVAEKPGPVCCGC